VAEDPAQAKEIPKALLAVLLAVPEGEHILETNGLDPADAAAIRQGLAAEGMRAAIGQVTTEMVDVLTLSGTAAEVRERVEELVDAGVTHPVLSAIGPHADQVIGALAR